MANRYFGLDGEMTASDLAQGGRLVQIGLATGTEPEDRVAMVIGWAEGEFTADPKAMAVHGISVERILAAPRAREVDQRLAEWCLARGARTDRRAAVAVGWNVGAFDMPFVRDALPMTWALFSRRTVDLNAVCFTLGGSLRLGGSTPKWSTWKRLAKEAAQASLLAAGVAPSWHDAGYDALASLAAWNFLRDRIAGLPMPAPAAAPAPPPDLSPAEE